MRSLFFLFLFPILAFAHDDPLAHKKGIVFGLGGAYSRYVFPAEFEGAEKDKLDDSAALFGGLMQLGYDFVIEQRVLIGFRGEGLITDTFGTGSENNNVLRGKMRSATALLRLGVLFQAKFYDLVGDPAPLLLEPFVEGGITSGHRSFVKEYDPDGTDEYVDNLEEEFQGGVLTGGVNLTNGSGGFFEVKGVYTGITNSHQSFSGHKIENGGASTSTERIDNEDKGFFTWAILFGQHF